MDLGQQAMEIADFAPEFMLLSAVDFEFFV
jgi:hypothetical protein